MLHARAGRATLTWDFAGARAVIQINNRHRPRDPIAGCNTTWQMTKILCDPRAAFSSMDRRAAP
jgi:hypothetical protein